MAVRLWRVLRVERPAPPSRCSARIGATSVSLLIALGYFGVPAAGAEPDLPTFPPAIVVPVPQVQFSPPEPQFSPPEPQYSPPEPQFSPPEPQFSPPQIEWTDPPAVVNPAPPVLEPPVPTFEPASPVVTAPPVVESPPVVEAPVVEAPVVEPPVVQAPPATEAPPVEQAPPTIAEPPAAEVTPNPPPVVDPTSTAAAPVGENTTKPETTAGTLPAEATTDTAPIDPLLPTGVPEAAKAFSAAVPETTQASPLAAAALSNDSVAAPSANLLQLAAAPAPEGFASVSGGETDYPWMPAPSAMTAWAPCIWGGMPLGVDGTLSSPFGVRGREFHRGVDFGATLGSPIFSALDGTVADAGPAPGFGQWIVVDSQTSSGLVSTVYGHMYPAGVLVKKGDKVQAGQRIGLVGSNGQSSGPHLHFEVWRGGRTEGGAPVDPMAILSSKTSVAPPAGCNASAPITAKTVPEEFRPWLQKGGSQCPGLSAPLLAAQIMQESGFRTDAVSPAGARGPAQFMPTTWEKTAVDGDNDGRRDINSVPDAVMTQAKLMCSNLEAAHKGIEAGTLAGDPVDLALAGYNAGMGAVTRAGGMPSGGQYTTETQPYVARIRSMTSQFSVVMQETR